MSERAGTAWAVVVAAGEGQRMRAGAFSGALEGALEAAPRKPFLELAGRAILLRTLDAVAACPEVERTVVAVAPEDVAATEEILAPGRERLRVAAVVAGGARRQDTVRLALDAVPEDVAIVAVHDGVRPFVSADVFSRAIEAARRTGAACVAAPVKDTLKRVEPSGAARGAPAIRGTVDRSGLWAAQTPQAFRAADLRRLIHEAAREGLEVTDDAQLFDRKGLPVEAVQGDSRNIKITTPEDLRMAEAILARPGGAEDLRVGTGCDCHPLAAGRRLVVCGVELESAVGGDGHSDADAATHAVIDALLGACAMGDIGTLFPDTDPALEGAESVALLADVSARVRGAGFEPRSLDVTVMLEGPRLAPHIKEMCARLAESTGLPPARVSVKAKTMNGVGPVGRGEACAAQAIAVVLCCNSTEAPG